MGWIKANNFCPSCLSLHLAFLDKIEMLRADKFIQVNNGHLILESDLQLLKDQFHSLSILLVTKDQKNTQIFCPLWYKVYFTNIGW